MDAEELIRTLRARLAELALRTGRRPTQQQARDCIAQALVDRAGPRWLADALATECVHRIIVEKLEAAGEDPAGATGVTIALAVDGE